jgi:hypothetical protein
MKIKKKITIITIYLILLFGVGRPCMNAPHFYGGAANVLGFHYTMKWTMTKLKY